MPGPAEKPRSNAKLKRAARDKARREKAFRMKKPGLKEKLLSGCFVLGILGGLILIAALTYACLTAE